MSLSEAAELKFDYEEGYEAPNTPLGQVFLHPFETRNESIVCCALGFRDPIDVQALKQAISNSLMIKHLRFCSIMVRDLNGNREHWQKTRVNVDDHVVVHHTTAGIGESKEAAVNSFLAEIAETTPLSENKPLWDVHVLPGLQCVVLRVHHAIGDGVSLMSMLSACFGKTSDGANAKNTVKKSKDDAKWNIKEMCDFMISIWYTIFFMIRGFAKLFLVKDKVSIISGGGGGGADYWPKKIVTAKFMVEDFKSIKKFIPGITINDVLLGVVSSGLSKYFNLKSNNARLHVTAVIAVNLRKHVFLQGMSDLMTMSSNDLNGWGNKSSILFLPIHCCAELHPLYHVKTMKAIMDKKKKSFEAYLNHKMSTFLAPILDATKFGSLCFHKAMCNTTLAISNIMGPSEELVIANNPVTYIRVNVSNVANAITMHLVSYAGRIDLQVMVAKHIIPDPEILVNCFKESFLEMKNSFNILV